MQNQPRNYFYIAIATCLLALMIYIWLATNMPFGEAESDRLKTVLGSIFVPLFCGATIGLVIKEMGTQSSIGKMWLAFGVGIWLWVLAEWTWASYYFVTGDWLDVSPADLLWIVGFAGLAVALKIQYELVYQTKVPNWQMFAWVLFVLAATALVVFITNSDQNFANYLAYFYPVADLATGAVAVFLFWQFRGGLFSWPWAGLFVMGLADSVYAWLEASAMLDTLDQGWSLFADTTYLAAYLILGLGFFLVYLVLRYGPEIFSNPTASS